MSGSGGAQGRTLTWWGFLGLVLVYLAIIRAGGRLIGGEVDPAEGFDTAGNVIRAGLIPIALSAVFAVARRHVAAVVARDRPRAAAYRAVGVRRSPIVLLAVAVIRNELG